MQQVEQQFKFMWADHGDDIYIYIDIYPLSVDATGGAAVQVHVGRPWR